MTVWDRLRAEPDALEVVKMCLALTSLDLSPYISPELWRRSGELYRLIERAELDEAEGTDVSTEDVAAVMSAAMRKLPKEN